MGLRDKEGLRRELMSRAEPEAFVRTYGEAARPMLEAALDTPVEELAARYEESGRGFFEYLRGDGDAVLVSRDQAAKILASLRPGGLRSAASYPSHSTLASVLSLTKP